MFKKKKTMKKIYQNPTIKIVKVELQRMMQSSDVRYFGGTTKETSGNLSRKGSFWDDEDDEDYDY